MYNPDKHHRHSVRLRNYDYANIGTYFVTACLNERIQQDVTLQQQGAINRAPTDVNFNFPTFGYIENGVMILNDCGKIAKQIWEEIPQHYPNIELGEFVVMPDHVHGIIKIRRGVDLSRPECEMRAELCVDLSRPKLCNNLNPKCGLQRNNANTATGGFSGTKNPMLNNNLSHIIRWFKGRVAFECCKIDCNFKWQRNFWEHIIRDEQSYKDISQYIIDNPVNWGKDELYV